MHIYKSRYGRLSGSDEDIVSMARREFRTIQKVTPRRKPYVRSRYFKRDKVFVSMFWEHLAQKRYNEQVYRLRYYRCAIDLLRNATGGVEVSYEDKGREIFYRFAGQSIEGLRFYVQVKNDTKTGRKDFVSVFPEHRHKK